MFTLKRPVTTPYLEILPYEKAILINDIPAELRYVVRHDYRVDLAFRDKRAFLVEHVLGCLKLAGISSTKVYGTSTEYDFSRQSFRDAYKLGLKPSSVIGNPYGTLDMELYYKIKRAGKREVIAEGFGIKERARISSPYGEIEIFPSDKFEVLVEHENLRYSFSFEDEKIAEIVKAKTPYLYGYSSMTLPHVIGDVLGDICGIGKINRAMVKISPKKEYHNLTIGILKRVELVD